jgi:hypothetical protein
VSRALRDLLNEMFPPPPPPAPDAEPNALFRSIVQKSGRTASAPEPLPGDEPAP